MLPLQEQNGGAVVFVGHALGKSYGLDDALAYHVLRPTAGTNDLVSDAGAGNQLLLTINNDVNTGASIGRDGSALVNGVDFSVLTNGFDAASPLNNAAQTVRININFDNVVTTVSQRDPIVSATLSNGVQVPVFGAAVIQRTGGPDSKCAAHQEGVAF